MGHVAYKISFSSILLLQFCYSLDLTLTKRKTAFITIDASFTELHGIKQTLNNIETVLTDIMTRSTSNRDASVCNRTCQNMFQQIKQNKLLSLTETLVK